MFGMCMMMAMRCSGTKERLYLDGFIAAARGGRQAQHTKLALIVSQLLDGQNNVAVPLGSVALIHNQTDDLLVGANAYTYMHSQLELGPPGTGKNQRASEVKDMP